MKTSARKRKHERELQRHQRTVELKAHVYKTVTLPNGVTVEYSSHVKATLYGRPERVHEVIEAVKPVPTVPFNYPYPQLRKLGQNEEAHMQEITLTPEESLFIQKLVRDHAMKTMEEEVDLIGMSADEAAKYIEMSHLQYYSANLMVKLMAPFKEIERRPYTKP
jgi:hypothetical protein